MRTSALVFASPARRTTTARGDLFETWLHFEQPFFCLI